jgi:DNA-binding MarR family transcriptional regulator
VGEISQHLLTDPGSLTPLLKRLESEGLLQRNRSREDERVVMVQLTDKGRALQQQARCRSASQGQRAQPGATAATAGRPAEPAREPAEKPLRLCCVMAVRMSGDDLSCALTNCALI